MAKKNITRFYFNEMSSDEIMARYNHNTDTVRSIHMENAALKELYSEAKKSERTARIQAKLDIYNARLNALQNPTVTESVVTPQVEETDISVAL